MTLLLFGSPKNGQAAEALINDAVQLKSMLAQERLAKAEMKKELQINEHRCTCSHARTCSACPIAL